MKLKAEDPEGDAILLDGPNLNRNMPIFKEGILWRILYLDQI